MESEVNDLLEMSWEIFQNLRDTKDIAMAKICAKMAIKYDLDITALPENIYDNVQLILKEKYLDAMAHDAAMSKLEEEHYVGRD